MTIIFSNMLDDDCKTLRAMWKGFDNVNLIEITPLSVDYEDIVNKAISEEDNTLILCGHGSMYGLFFPDFYKGEYLIHENNVHLIKAEKVICCWCYAADFCIENHLHCFATSMFISNEKEAYDNGIMNYTQEQINKNGNRFYTEVNHLLKEEVGLDEWVMRLGSHMDIENAIDVFNRQALYYN